ncbi:hypothetical protein NEUTE2DRAFT_122960 [Neurospora tetrasperma FGSC 2509]|nr:hypothetical protein NEUTE2DRAFT_122960 [Neurospora tetrasperma FGSC 2509]
MQSNFSCLSSDLFSNVFSTSCPTASFVYYSDTLLVFDHIHREDAFNNKGNKDNGHFADTVVTTTVVENPSPRTERSPAENQSGTLGTQVNTTSTSITRQVNHVEGNKFDLEPTSTAVTSTEPVGVYYPPRRPNIFRARAKHLRFPEYDRNPAAGHAVDKSEDAIDDESDDFSFEGLEGFESEAKQEMEKKTEQFMSVVQQCAWRPRVEDLGTVQEIEDSIVVWCSSNVGTESSDVARNSSPVASRPEEDINVEPLQLPLSKISSSPISQRGSQFAPAPAPTLLHTCTKTSHRIDLQSPRPTYSHYPSSTNPSTTSLQDDFDMFRALQHHRALARANEQQETAIDTPIHHPYRQTEAQPFRRATLRDCFPQGNKPTDSYKQVTTNSLITNNTIDKEIVETDNKNPSSKLETSNLGQNDLVGPLTSSMSQLKISQTPSRPGDGYSANWLTASPFSIHNHTDNISNKSASKPRLSRREQKKLESRKWINNAFIDQKGRLDTKMNRLGKMRKRLHHRCTWVKKPFSLREFVHRAEQPVPFLVLTDPEGCRHFLEDPKNTAATMSDSKSLVRASTMARSATNLGTTPPAESEAVILFNHGTPARIDKSNYRNNNIHNEKIVSGMETNTPATGVNTSAADKRDALELMQASGWSYAYDHSHLSGRNLSTTRTRPSSVDNRPTTSDANYYNVNNETTDTEPYEREDHKDGALGEMTTREYSQFISWRVASLMSPEPSGLEPIVETEERDLEEPLNHGLDSVEFDEHDIIDDPSDDEDTGNDEDNDWLLDSLTDDDLDHFTIEDFQEICSAREDRHNENTGKLLLQDFLPPRKQSSSRQNREPRTPKWKDHSLVDGDGFMKTRERKRQEEGRRLRGQCNWLRVPSLAVSTDSSVPDLIMTSPEGRSYSLHDPMDYE